MNAICASVVKTHHHRVPLEDGDCVGFRSQGSLNSLDRLDKVTMIYFLSFYNAVSLNLDLDCKL